jgi:hypothetical protein
VVEVFASSTDKGKYPALNDTESSCACPGHAFEKSAPVDAVPVVVMQKLILFSFDIFFSPAAGLFCRA